jgi:hypothetical protein
MFRSAVSQKFNDVSEILSASIIKAVILFWREFSPLLISLTVKI